MEGIVAVGTMSLHKITCTALISFSFQLGPQMPPRCRAAIG